MSLSVSNTTRELIPLRSKRLEFVDLTFDSSYAFGGETITPIADTTLVDIQRVIMSPTKGYTFDYDHTNQKLKVFAPAPPIVVEEHHVLDSNNQFTLKYPPAYIMSITGYNKPIALTTTGATLSAGQAQPTAVFSAGARSTFTVSPTNLITNGTFTSNITGWTDSSGSDWSSSGQKASKASGATAATLTLDTWVARVGGTYRLSFDLGGTSGAEGITPTIGGVAGTARTTAASYEEDIVATAASGLVFTPAGATNTLTLDNVEMYEQDVWITYVTQAWKDVWDNLVQEETVAVDTGVTEAGTLANTPLLIQAINATGTTSTNSCLFNTSAEAAVDSGAVGITNSTGTLLFNATDAVTSASVTYVKKPTSGFLYDRFINEENMSAGTNICYPAKPLLLWGFSGQALETDATTNRAIHYDGTKGTDNCQFDLLGIVNLTAKNNTRILQDGVTTGVATYVWGRPWEIQGLQPLEVPNGTDLSALTGVKAILIGV